MIQFIFKISISIDLIPIIYIIHWIIILLLTINAYNSMVLFTILLLIYSLNYDISISSSIVDYYWYFKSILFNSDSDDSIYL